MAKIVYRQMLEKRPQQIPPPPPPPRQWIPKIYVFQIYKVIVNFNSFLHNFHNFGFWYFRYLANYALSNKKLPLKHDRSEVTCDDLKDR